MPSLEAVIAHHKGICDDARSLIVKKGADYNRAAQKTGNTLFNLQVAEIVGITDSTTQSILVRLSDKFMRLVSLTKEPHTEAEVKDESVRDTVVDLINYAAYLYIMWQEARENRKQ